MRQQARTNQHAVKYKGYKLVQVPWNSYEGKQYAKWLFDSEGKQVLHAGYSKHCSHKQLRMMIRQDVDYLIPALMRAAERRNNEATTKRDHSSL